MKKLNVIALLLSALIEISSTISIYSIISDSDHVPHDNNRIPKKLQPVELMVDATNHLGFTILDLHSRLNKNNIAFSPCGLMSVLVALYEGSGGKSAVEIKEALRFPRERDIVRIGMRDIHRRLRVSCLFTFIVVVLAKKMESVLFTLSICPICFFAYLRVLLDIRLRMFNATFFVFLASTKNMVQEKPF